MVKTNTPPVDYPPKSTVKKITRGLKKLLEPFEIKSLLMALGGVSSIWFYCLQFKWLQGLAVFGISIIIAGAAGAVGFLLGFLFGLPRVFESEQTERKLSRANTNLDQIADWLTKIIVGVGLTQISTIIKQVQYLVDYLKPGLGNVSSSTAFALAILVYFSVSGFLVGFLWTKLFVAIKLRKADELLNRVDMVEERVDAQQKILDRLALIEQMQQQIKVQQVNDAKAKSLVDRQLNTAYPAVSQEELEAAIANASPPVKIDIFSQAEDVRTTYWRNPQSKLYMERTIPIFRVFIKNPPEGKSHEIYGQLGFALKDKTEPEWEEAEQALTTAIERRGNWQEQGKTFYELSRAICRIVLDGDNPQMRDKILDDLSVAVQSKCLTEAMIRNPVNQILKDWMEHRHILYQDLCPQHH